MAKETNLDELSDLFDTKGEQKVEPKAPVAKKVPEAIARKTVRIFLEESDDIPPGGLFLQHNGRPYLLKPGVEADIPLFLKEILDHAVISVPHLDPVTRKIVDYRDRLKYAYRVIG